MSAWAIVRRIVVILGPSLYSAVTPSIIESTRMINLCQFGAGRIGAIHAANIAAHPAARLAAIVDIDAAAAQRLADLHGAAITTGDAALADPAIDAVIIASATDTHAALVEAASRA